MKGMQATFRKRGSSMAKFVCPNCRGGFPEGPANDGCCPWCGQSLDGSYEVIDRPLVSKTDEAESNRLMDIFK
jgi:hypothetical protein